MATRGAVRARVERLCEAELPSSELRVRVLAELRQVLAYDAHVWLLTDPVTRVGTSPLAEIPGLSWSELPTLIRRRYSAGSDWSRFRPAGAADVATTVFADRFGQWAWLDLWRRVATFAAEERAFLATLVPPVTVALRRAQARAFTAEATGAMTPAAAVVILDPDLRLRGETSAAARALFELNPPDDGAPVVPAAAYNVAATLLAAEQGTSVGPAWSRVHLGGGLWVTLSAARMDADNIAVTIEPSTPAQRRELFALANGLSPRERQVLAELATGADSRAVADRLVISEHTVHDHVKAILAKTGCPTRAKLLSRVIG